MSETMNASDTARRTHENAARSGFAAVDSAAKATKEAVAQTAALTEKAANRVKQANETATRIASEATSAVSKATASGADAMMTGVRAVADISGKVGDASFGHSHQMLASAARAMDVYTDATERSAERVQALVASCMTLGRGLQKMQHMWLEMLDHSIETATHKPQDLLRCKTLLEVAEVQRDLYIDAVNHAVTSSSRLLELAGRTAQDAVQPLQTQHH